MRLKRYSILALLMVFSALAFAQTKDLTLDEILDRHFKAQGGVEKMKAVKTMRMTGRMTFGPGMEFPGVLVQSRPNRQRMDFTVQGMNITQAYDGKTAWQVMPFQGNKDPEPMGEADAKDMIDDADFDGPLLDYKQKGNQVELVGKADVEGSPTYKLKVTLKGGTVRFVYLDTDSFLEVHSEGKRMVRGSEVEFESNTGDYKEVGGLMFPHSIESGPKGAAQKQKLTIEKIELNPKIEDASFVMPEKKKDDAKPGDAKPAEKKPETKPPSQI